MANRNQQQLLDRMKTTKNKDCYHWQAGRCNKSHHGQFMHSDTQKTTSLTWRRPNYDAQTSEKSKSSSSSSSKKVLCRYFLAGNCKYGEKCRFLHSWFKSETFSLLAQLEGHKKDITGIVLPKGSDKLCSSSNDECVRVWDCNTGQCVATFNLGTQTTCIMSEKRWIFVGVKNEIKAWNYETQQDRCLDCCGAGQVHAMVVENEMIFAGTEDGRILTWKFGSDEQNCFEPVASLSGHHGAVVSMIIGAMKLYSGSMDHSIKVWDVVSLQCVQTLNGHTDVVTSLICWEEYLLSCSLDKTIKVWAMTESEKIEVYYTRNEEHGVLALAGMHNAQSQPVLLCSCNDNCVRLYDLPSFGKRGQIFAKDEIKAMHVGPDGLFFTGDGAGELKVWKWLNE